jgi:ABC-type branched-subunit amino acid transport system substrate-binding protein
MQVALESGYGTDRSTFHVYASVRDQARVMVDFVTQDGGATPRVALLHGSDRAGQAGAAGAREQADKHGAVLVADVGFAPGQLSAPQAVSQLKAASADAVLFFGGGADAVAFLGEADRQQWRPRVVTPASMVGPGVLALSPDALRGLYLASPIGSIDPAAQETAAFLRLVQRLGGSEAHAPFQVLAYAGARLLEEGLRRSGRDVSRDKLVDVLGTLWEFPTGVTPPLTYRENRRVGALGAEILTIDPGERRLAVAAPWREPR